MNFLAISQADLEKIVLPIIQICNTIIPVLIAVVVAIGGIYCIILGVKYAKADEPQEHEKAKNGLKNAIIGFVLIFVLLIMLKVGATVFIDFWSNYAA